MILSKVCLSLYSFGYSAGFVKDERPAAAAVQTMSLAGLADLSERYVLGGVEFPVDRCFPVPESGTLVDFVRSLGKRGMRAVFDLEEFSPAYVERVAPLLGSLGATFVRAKISNFYGGNRYKHPEFSEHFTRFAEGLESCVGVLADHDLKLIVENHQDVVLADLLSLIARFGEDRVGINWDVGNSLPAGETPTGFAEKASGHIANVHLKDYRVFRCPEGYIMSRCALGRGVVDFPSVLRVLPDDVPMTIELGAMIGRVADVNHPAYWQHMDGVSAEGRTELLAFIDSVAEDGDGWRSAWERRLPPSEVAAREMAEIEESIEFLRQAFQHLGDRE